MVSETLSRESAQSFYDRIGGMYDWFSKFEAKAKKQAMFQLNLAPGLRLLNVGLGTGKEQREFLERLSPGGACMGLDISPRMLQIASTYSKGWLCRADAGHLPFSSGAFDRLYCAYVLDLIPALEIPGWLAGFRRVLKPGGRMVILSLTEGVDAASRAVVGIWKSAYALSPSMCGGCRPLALSKWVAGAGFEHIEISVVVQLGLPSEVVAAS